MNCPSCDRALSSGVFNCPFCGYDVDFIQNVTSLKHEILESQQAIGEHFTKLNQRLDRLERLAKSTGQATPQAASAPEITPPLTPEPKKPNSEAKIQKPKIPIPKVKGNYESHLGQKWLLVVGVILMVFGVGYFLKYSFDQNWIGPAGRVAMAYLAGLAFLGAGNAFRKKGLGAFGLYLIGGGIATLYFSNYAAFQIYHLFGQATSFALMIVVTALATALSVVYDNKWLAVLGMIGGFFTPILLSTGEANQIVLMTYMTILNVGILSVSAFKGWRLLQYLGFLFTWGLLVGWYDQNYTEAAFIPTLIFINIFFVIYELAPFAFAYRSKDLNHPMALATGFLNGITALVLTHQIIFKETDLPYASVASVAYAMFFLALASVIRRKRPENPNAFFVLLAKGMLFLAITIPLLLNGSQIIIAWSLQATAALWIALRLKSKWLYQGAIGFWAVTLGAYLLGQISGYGAGAFDLSAFGRWATHAALLGGLYFSAHTLGLDSSKKKISGFAWGIFIVILFSFLTDEVTRFFGARFPGAVSAATSVLWAFFAIALIIVGFIQRNKPLRGVAIGLFAVTVLKVFLNDMQNVDTPFRILSFLILGLMLIGASYLYYRNKDHSEKP